MLGKTVGRRNFLKLLGVSPIAAKVARDEAAQKLVGQVRYRHETSTLEQVGALDYGVPQTAPQTNSYLTTAQRQALLARALQVPALRAELESALYAARRGNSVLDPDLAVLRSYSMMAKLTFQRQRDVQAEIDASIKGMSPWDAVGKWSERILKMVGLQ